MAPGVGTVSGGYAGAVAGSIAGATAGGVVGGAIGYGIGSIVYAAQHAGDSQSTGRSDPANLNEQLALKSAQSNPAGEDVIPIKLGDGRWPAADGWVKMAQNINGIEVHDVRNVNTGAAADFKFK